MEIVEAVERRKLLEKDIQNLIIAFEKQTNLKINDVQYVEQSREDSAGFFKVKTIKIKAEI